MSKNAVLVVNLGSPDSTAISDVRTYLREFLSDDRVLDTPKPIQQFVLNCFILPTRPERSAEACQKVWTEQGSPLIVTNRNVQDLLQDRIDDHVELAIRYGNPSIPRAIDKLKSKGRDIHREIFRILPITTRSRALARTLYGPSLAPIGRTREEAPIGYDARIHIRLPRNA